MTDEEKRQLKEAAWDECFETLLEWLAVDRESHPPDNPYRKVRE